VKRLKDRLAFSLQLEVTIMKMFRLALAGVLPAFVLLVCIQLNARVASTPDIRSWFMGHDTVNDHIWQPVGTLYNGATYPTTKVAAPSQSRQLVFEDRVAYQRLIEEVYWRHRIWPKERPDRKPSLAVMSQATIEQKVQDYLRHSELLEQEWQKPITPEQLQAEMDRMAQRSKQPEVLRELFAALGNDPFVIAECLARPVLSERLQFATVEWRKEPLESWRAKESQNEMPNVMAAANANYTLPAISDQPSECIGDSWTATTTTNAPTARVSHTAVWTGSEMIVWGGSPDNSNYLNTGGKYNPSTDSWTATSTTNAPTARVSHTAVWTGSEMIVWGGFGGGELNTGGRYNPSTNSWTATTTANAPSGRDNHTAVWTGSEMIVWGGLDSSGVLKTGGRYNPSTNSWTATSTTNAPTARIGHTPVWTGSEMIVWGGFDFPGIAFNTGGRYNPSTNSWTATSTTNAPTARMGHTAVWTGSEMIVWGGGDFANMDFNTGGRYNPGTGSWIATAAINAPAARGNHTAVWTGSEMIVWGGRPLSNNMVFNTGGRYNPSMDSWTATSTTNAFSRTAHTAVWTDSEMIVWGAYDENFNIVNTGGRYCAQAGGSITLSAAKRKVGGINTVRLTWSGATSTYIDVYRDGMPIVRTKNRGSYVVSTGDTGRARYTYRVCEFGTSTCSNDAIATFAH
jgi:N-acetylneuraminic acid mutarotase